MDDTTLTFEILDDLVQDLFDRFYQDDAGDGYVNLDEMDAAWTTELHAAVVRQILNLTGLRTLREVLMSRIDYAGDRTN